MTFTQIFIMKTFFKLLLVILAVLPTTSCNDFLEINAPGTLGEQTLYTKEGADALLIGAYSLLDGSPNNTQNGWSSMNNWIYGGVASDEAHKGTEYGNGPGIELIENYTADPSVTNYLAKWEAVYEGVQRANDVLRLLIAMPEGTLSDEEITQIRAEAIFLRGVYHLEAAKLWRNVPYVDETVHFNAKNYNVPNDGPIWDKIEQDFRVASEQLSETKTDVGRANKWAAKAFLAKVLMFQHRYGDANTLLTDIIQNGVTSSGIHYQLLENYFDNFNATIKNHSESVFAVQMSVGDGANGQNGNAADWLIGMYSGPSSCCGYYQPSFTLANTFKTDADRGLPLIDTFNEVDITNDMGIESGEPFELYQGPLDPRIDHTIGRRGIPYLDWGNHPGKDWIRQQSCGGPYSQKKYTYFKANKESTSEGASSNYIANNLVLIRYADVLLWAAEAEVEAGSLVQAEAYVNLVRTRAANPNGWVKKYVDDRDPSKGFSETPAANYHIGLYKGDFAAKGQDFAREAIRFERRLELGMEGHRFFDLQRYDNESGSMADILNAYIQHETSRPGYDYLYMNGARFTKGKNEIFPIPQSQIDISYEAGQPTLTQNPGY